jgi:hypothetical protein
MKLTRSRLLLLALPLALGLSACGKKDEVGAGAETAAPIAKIAPPPARRGPT